MLYRDVRVKVLKKIKPQNNQELAKATDVLCKELEAAIAYLRLSATVFVGGSTAKGTGLKNNHDVDIFVRFKKGEQLSDDLETIIRLLPDAYERVHGSRDYFQLTRGKIDFEIVPVKYIRSWKNAENVTDMSPLHVAYICERITPAQRDDVRLAKQFCKAQKVYGAESYINGFSGHILELLTVYYGSFQKLLAAASSWGERVVLDVEGHHKNPLGALNEAKTQSPLIIIDPVQPDRNAAAALSKESYERFIVAARRFQKNPSVAAFTLRKLTKKSIKNSFNTGSLVILELEALPGKRDTVGTKCLKAFEYVTNHLEGFTVLHTDFEYVHERGTALAYIHVAEKTLPQTFEQPGPPIKEKNAVDNFQLKHKGRIIIEKNKRLCVIRQRTLRTLRSQVTELITTSPVTSRVARVQL